MTVGTTLRSWSATAANNSPKGTDIIGTSADDELRQIQATVRQYLASQASSVVAAATTDLSAVDGHLVPISGNSTITGLGTEAAGIEYILNFSGSPILVHSSALQLPGQATINATVGDMCVAESLGAGNWKIFGYTKLNGKPVVNTANTQPTRQVLTSGTGATYTTPTGATRINVRMVGGGGGGAGATANSGTTGNATTFSTFTAGGGGSGITNGGGGGAGGTASGGNINIPGGYGAGGTSNAVAGNFPTGGNGGSSVLGGAGGGQSNNTGLSAATNSGGGGGGGGGASATNSGGGGGSGGYVESLITNPAATYTYTIGAAANGGAAGTFAGGNGAAGIIIVDEWYD